MEAFQKALDVGINFIDTAEIYGRGKSEELIAEAIRGHREDVVIGTKIWPWNLSYGRLKRAADRSRQRLGVDVIDLYQIHWPNPFFPIRNTMKSMKRLVEAGKIRSVGVSNFNLTKMKSAQESLAPLDLASNQVKYNLLDRGVELDLLPYAETSGITIIAYSPLAFGLLTGRYKPETKPTSMVQTLNHRFSQKNLTRLGNLLLVISEIASEHNKTLSQVSLNYLICKPNVVAIPGAKRSDHVADSAGATDWRLTESEVSRLTSTASDLKFDKLSGIPNLLRTITYL